MARKILVIMLLAAVAAVGSQAFSISAAQQDQKQSPAPPKVSEKPVASSSSGSGVAAQVEKQGPVGTAHPTPPSFRPSPVFPSAPVAPKSDKSVAPKSATKLDAKKTGASGSPVSASPLDSKVGKRELVIERGLVTLIHDNKVPANEAGMLTGLSVEEGQSVEQDDIVAQIDNRSVEARRQIAEAEELAAKAQAENEAEIEVAEKAVEVTKAEYDQSVEIRKVNKAAVADTQLRKDLFNWQKSIAQVKQAKNEKHIAGLTFNAKKAQHNAASIELDLRQVRSPFRGQVVEVMKRPGDWVTVGEPIMHIVGLDKVRVKGFVLMSGANGASDEEVLGKDVTITVFGAGERKHTVKGKIGFASPVIEGVGSSRQFRIWADVQNEKTVDPVTGQEVWKIQPGSMATMTIDLTPRPVASRVQTYRPVSAEVKGESGKKTTAVER